MQLALGSAPAPGAANRALAVGGSRPNQRTIQCRRAHPSSARGRAEQQPGRLRSPFLQPQRSSVGFKKLIELAHVSAA